MSTTINFEPPYLSDNIITFPLTATFEVGNKKKGKVIADCNDLLSWLFKAKIESVDLFFLAICIYGVDRLLARKPNSVDGWSREIILEIPLIKPGVWTANKEEIQSLLSFLTGDYWSVKFYKNSFEIPPTDIDPLFKRPFTQVNLFSGGLDSLIGAINDLEKSKSPILFVSHYDPLMAGPKKDQLDLSEELELKYGKSFCRIPSVRVFLSDTTISRETTSRSRSLLFLALAQIAAEPLNLKIVVPENGTVSVNYPLSPSRRSACSTRTTHPTFLSLVEQLFNKIGLPSNIENPYWDKTKGEMVSNCKNIPYLEKILHFSNSCGKRGHRAHWDNKTATHCGICMPCIYRRASLLNIIDNTTYGSSINNLDFHKKKGQDVGALLDFLHSPLTSEEIKHELISNGLKDYSHLIQYVRLVERTRHEVADWIKANGNKAIRQKGGIL